MVDPSTFNFGKVTNTVLFVRKFGEFIRITLSMNITLNSNIPFFNVTESTKLSQKISKNLESFKFNIDTINKLEKDNIHHMVHSTLFQGILTSFQFHPQLIKVYERVVTPKYVEIATTFAPKIIKTRHKI